MGLLDLIRKQYPAPSEKEKHDHRNVKAEVLLCRHKKSPKRSDVSES